MIGNNEMEIDPPFPHLLQETSTVIEAADTSVVILDSPTPVRVTKKRKISISGVDQNKSEEDSSDAKKTTATVPTPNTPINAVGSTIKADMKRLLQSQESDISKYYQIKSNTKLVLVQGNSGEAPYRNHPETIKELNDYFNEFRVESETEGFDFINFIKEKYSGLIGKLAQDSQVPQMELLANLKSILFPTAAGFKEFPIDSSLLDGIVEKVSYGHPDAGNNFTSWSCTFWQVKDLELLGETIGKHFLTNFVIRNAARMILEGALKTATDVTNIVENVTSTNNPMNVVNLVDDLPINLMKIESGTGTPKKKEKREKEKQQNTTSSSTNSNNISTAATTPQAPPQVKISSFFAKLKKPEGIEKPSGEYFQPFFVKPDVSLAPLNQLRDLKRANGKTAEDNFDYIFQDKNSYWSLFRKEMVQVPFKRQTCLCVGYDGRPIRTVLKLLKFEENYRPAYLGTWLKAAPKGTVSGRRPFAKITEIDYEYDSDAEWDEGEDPEGESLSDLDDEEDEEDDDEISDEEMETLSNSESADSWLVPHGYLSDDEGVDEVHPGELEDAAREAELMPPPTASSKKSKERRKFIPKEPMILGPFFDDQVIPQYLQGSTLQFINNERWQGSPFANYEAVFVGLEGAKKSSSSSESKEDRSDRGHFPENLLPSMIQIINLNPSAGITKLYDEFILQHGKVVSRRSFESKLNQITTGKMKCEKSGKLRWIFKDEIMNTCDSNTMNVNTDIINTNTVNADTINVNMNANTLNADNITTIQ